MDHRDHPYWEDMCQFARILSNKAPFARIAGGCPRNMKTGKDIKDIDVFVETPEEAGKVIHALDLKIIREPSDPFESEEDYEEEQDKNTAQGPFDVWKCEDKTQGWDFDIICRGVSWNEAVMLFPDNLSRMWLYVTIYNVVSLQELKEAIDDRVSQTVTYDGLRMTDKRLARLKELYSDWTFKDTSPKVQLEFNRPSKRREPDHAPFWWEMKKPSPDAAMDAVRALSKG